MRSNGGQGATPLVVLAMTALLGGCGERLPACAEVPPLDTRPAAASDVTGIVPLGALNPSGHTFPTDHIYFYVNDGSSVPVVSPGEVTITELESVQYGGERTDYTVRFALCDEVYGYHHHLVDLVPELARKVQGAHGCEEYSTGGFDVKRCRKRVHIPLVGGDAIGTAGNGALAFDFGMLDSRTELDYASPERGIEEYDDAVHAVCPIDYFEPAVAADLESQLGDYSGTWHRTAEPLCGEIEQDEPGTAQGRWFRQGEPDLPEDPHVALAHDNVDPTIPVFSLGTSFSGSVGAWTFTPASSGQVNRDFPDVVPGEVYCWEISGYGEPSTMLGELPDANTLHLELRGQQTCGAGPFSLSSPLVFER